MKTFREMQADMVRERRRFDEARQVAVRIVWLALRDGGHQERLTHIMDYLMAPDGCVLMKLDKLLVKVRRLPMHVDVSGLVLYFVLMALFIAIACLHLAYKLDIILKAVERKEKNRDAR